LTGLVPGSKGIFWSIFLLGGHSVGSANNSLKPFKTGCTLRTSFPPCLHWFETDVQATPL